MPFKNGPEPKWSWVMQSLRELLEATRQTGTRSPVDPIIAVFNHLHLQDSQQLDLDDHRGLFDLLMGCPIESLEQVVSSYFGFISKLISESMDISLEGNGNRFNL